MTDYWQGQRPWFALDGASTQNTPDDAAARDGATPARERPATTDHRSRRERPEEFVQRSIQRTYNQ